MTNKELYRQIMNALKTLRTEAPRNEQRAVNLKHPYRKVTGNLKYNSIKLEYIGNGVYKLYVDETIAPYMPYTEEPWTSPKWKGAKNPNENWFGNSAEIITADMATKLKGKYRKIKE